MKKVFGILCLLLLIAGIAYSQSEYVPYSYRFSQKFNPDLYSTKTREHTSLKPFFSDSLLKRHYDSLMNYGSDSASHSWGYRKLLTEHLIGIKNPGSAFYADLLPDFTVGNDFSNSLATHIASLGVQIGGNIGDKFSYYASGYQSSAVVPNYLSTYITQVGIVPGQAYA